MLALSGAGIILGIAKAYVETAPMLDIENRQPSANFAFMTDGNPITDYKGTENRIMVSIGTMPMILRHALWRWRMLALPTAADLKRIRCFVRILQRALSRAVIHHPAADQNTVLSNEQSYKRRL